MQDIEGKMLVCFGAGKALTNFVSLFPALHIETKIDCIVDNNSNKTGCDFIVNDTAIKVISFQELLGLDYDKTVILITSQYYVDIYNQLKCEGKSKDYICYIYRFIIDESHPYLWKTNPAPASLRRTKEPLILKKIHYCWFGKNPIPEQNKKYMESWKKYCPDYEIIEWNEDNYDFSHNKYARAAYENKMWAFVSDMVRLDVIYQYGGIYLDTDVELLKSPDDLLYQEGFLGTFYAGEVNTGLGFGAQKGNPLIKEMLEQYEKYEFLYDKDTKSLPLCVDYQTEYLKSKGYIIGGGYQNIDGVSIYAEEILENVCFDTGRVVASDNTVAVHHSHASWRDDNDRKEQTKRYEFWKQHFDNRE